MMISYQGQIRLYSDNLNIIVENSITPAGINALLTGRDIFNICAVGNTKTEFNRTGYGETISTKNYFSQLDYNYYLLKTKRFLLRLTEKKSITIIGLCNPSTAENNNLYYTTASISPTELNAGAYYIEYTLVMCIPGTVIGRGERYTGALNWGTGNELLSQIARFNLKAKNIGKGLAWLDGEETKAFVGFATTNYKSVLNMDLWSKISADKVITTDPDYVVLLTNANLKLRYEKPLTDNNATTQRISVTLPFNEANIDKQIYAVVFHTTFGSFLVMLRNDRELSLPTYVGFEHQDLLEKTLGIIKTEEREITFNLDISIFNATAPQTNFSINWLLENATPD